MKRIITVILALACVASFAAAASATTEATLTFSSFEGGGPEVWIEIDDPSVVTFRSTRGYDVAEGEPIPPGARYTETYVFAGLKPGSTGMTVIFGSAIVESRETRYAVEVDEALNVTLREENALSRFWFTRGGYLPSRSYEVFQLDDGYYLWANAGPSRKLDAAVVEALEGIIEEYGLISWDGFDESDSNALDGEGFCLDIAWEDGAAVHAAGDNAFPNGYFDAADAIEDLLCAVIPGEPESVTGLYRYEGEGFGGDFTIRVFEDETYEFYEGFLSSYMGGGDWFMSGSRLYMSERNGMYLFNTFIPVEGALVFVEEESDNFPYVRVPDMGRFIKDAPGGAGETAALAFDSFDGGGPEYTVEIGDPDILSYTCSYRYLDPDYEELDGATYTVMFEFTGLQAGSTRVAVTGWSPIVDGRRITYEATVDENLNVVLKKLAEEDLGAFVRATPTLAIEANGKVFYAALEDNPSAEALEDMLYGGGIEIDMQDYGQFEKVGPLPWTLTRSDTWITTEPGDVILYQGNKITIYYDVNTWNFTRLAKIDGTTREELLEAFGDGDVTVSFWLEWSE